MAPLAGAPGRKPDDRPLSEVAAMHPDNVRPLHPAAPPRVDPPLSDAQWEAMRARAIAATPAAKRCSKCGGPTEAGTVWCAPCHATIAPPPVFTVEGPCGFKARTVDAPAVLAPVPSPETRPTVTLAPSEAAYRAALATERAADRADGLQVLRVCEATDRARVSVLREFEDGIERARAIFYALTA